MSKEKHPDDEFKSRFLYSFGNHHMKENNVEVGARINTIQNCQAVFSTVWPVAGTYLMIVGNTCCQCSMLWSVAPVQYCDLAALMYKLGHVDADLKLVEEAVTLCDTEPVTHHILAILW